jgi:uncharacterized protein YcbX
MKASVASLFVYPVKSCRGVAQPVAQMTPRGIAHDREWLIVDESGRFITQREVPRLALIVPALSGGTLALAAPGLEVAIATDDDRDGSRITVTVWRDTLSAIDQGDAAAAALSGWLDRPVRLVRFDPAVQRLCNPEFAGSGGAHHSFADGYPVLVASEASLADLNARLPAPMPMDRFRPNLVLSGIGPYEEDHLDVLSVGRVTLKLVKPCTRCQITTTDQSTASVGIEPLPTLGGYRYNAALEGVTFGMNAIVVAGAGTTIGVGDVVECAFNF